MLLAGSMGALAQEITTAYDKTLKAVALTANAVMVGRPYIYGLANSGALGVAHVLRLLRDEWELGMALCGCATLADASMACLFKSEAVSGTNLTASSLGNLHEESFLNANDSRL